MAIGATPATSPALPASSATSKAQTDALDKDVFLKLLVSQLEHQDPLSPMENVEFTAQLAQFTTLEQIEAMNATLASLASMQTIANNTQVANFIGKEVVAQGDSVGVLDGEIAPFHYVLPSQGTDVTVTIANEDGVVVRQLEFDTQPAGEQRILWDGRDAQGQTVPDGTYHVSISAQHPSSGEPILAETMIQGVVEGVQYAADTPYLLVGGNRVDLASIISVRGEE